MNVLSWRWSLLELELRSVNKIQFQSLARTYLSPLATTVPCVRSCFFMTPDIIEASSQPWRRGGGAGRPTPPSPQREDGPFDVAVRRFKGALLFKRAYPDSTPKQRHPPPEITLPVRPSPPTF